MNLKELSNLELCGQMKSLADDERSLLHRVLLTIREIDRRRLYLDLGYANLFSYLTEKIGYSEGAAQRRLDAARLLGELPHIGARIQTGEINLSHISLVQKATRDAKNLSNKIISSKEKLLALDLVQNLPRRESEKIVAQTFNIPIKNASKISAQANGSIRIEFTLSAAQNEKLEALKEHLSHSVPTGDLAQIVEYLADKIIAHKQKLSKPKAQPTTVTATVAAHPKSEQKNKSISVKMRSQVLNSDNCCQFVHKDSGRKCSSRWQLEVDHAQPRWANGSNDLSNLQVYCKSHNVHKYRKEAGLSFG